MTNYYKTLDISPKSSEWKIFKAFQDKARENLNLELLEAIIIIGDEKPKKFHDLLLKHKALKNKSTGEKYMLHLNHRAAKSKKIDFKVVEHLLVENTFWEIKGFNVFLNCFGLNVFMEKWEGFIYTFRMKLIAFAIKFFTRFGIWLLLTIYVSYLFAIPLLFSFIFFFNSEYKKSKIQYYREKVIYPVL